MSGNNVGNICSVRYICSEMTRVAVGILRNNGKILVCQRKAGGRYALKWEFPGGKIEPGETVLQCLDRELQEEISVRIKKIGKMEVQTSSYDDGGLIEVAYCHISEFEGTPENRVFEQIRWVEPSELPDLDILEGNRSIVSALAKK